MAPFQYAENPSRENPLAGSIAATLRERGLIAGAGAQRVGDLQAQGTLANGAGNAGMISAIGNSVAAIPQAQARAREQDQQEQARKLTIEEMQRRSDELKALDQGYGAMMQAGGNRQALYDSLTQSGKGHLVPQVTKSFDEFDKAHAEVQKLRDEADTKATKAFADIGATIRDGGYDPASLQLALSDAKQKYGSDPQRLRQIQTIEQKLQADPTVANVRSIVDPMISLDPERRKEEETVREHNLTHQDRQATVAREQARDAETAGYHREELTRKDQELQIQKKRADAAMLAAKTGGAATKDDAVAIADAIEGGLQPPDVKSLYRLAGPVKAELSRRGFDLTRANLDWQAVQKLQATLNGSKVTNMRSSISTASESLDVIDRLADEWNSARIVKDGQVVPLNRAELLAAKSGAYGQKAQSIATQLEGQITDVVSELGQVYMGGNSPTDHALALAEKNLRAEWSDRTLRDMTKLARTNLRIRGNSLSGLTAMTLGGDKSEKTDQPVTVVTPGGTFTFPTQAAADEFKKKAGIP